MPYSEDLILAALISKQSNPLALRFSRGTRIALNASACWVALLAGTPLVIDPVFAGSCDQPSGSNPTVVTCTDDGLLDTNYTFGPDVQFVTIESGDFGFISTFGGEDTLTMLGGVVDSLEGGDDDDTFQSSGTVGDLVGGLGNDTIFVNGGTVSNVFGDDGDDLIVVNVGSVQRIEGAAGADQVEVKGGTVTFLDGGEDEDAVIISGGAVTTVNSDNGDDTVSVSGGSVDTLLTAAGGDTIVVSSGTIGTVNSGDGDDTINISGGTITSLRAGDGNDSINISDGSLGSVVSEAGNDTISVSGGSIQVLTSGIGDDSFLVTGGTIGALSGSSGSNQIHVKGGTVGNLFGGSDQDIIRLDGGTVTNINASSGADTVVLTTNSSVSGTINGGADLDRLSLEGSSSYSGEPLNFEQLLINSGASWTLSGASLNFPNAILYSSDQSGSLSIASGSTLNTGNVTLGSGNSLMVSGVLNASGMFVAGTIGGSGEINPGATLRVVDGTLAPGSSIGTLTVNQSIQLVGAPTLLVEIDPAASQNADLLAVNGSVTGTNSLAIEVIPLAPGLTADDYVAGNTYQVLTAAGSIDGDNPTVQLDGALPALVAVNVVGTPSTSGEIVLDFSTLTPTQVAKKAKDQTGSTNHQTITAAILTAAATTPSQPLVIATPSGTTTGPTIGSAVNSLTNTQLSQVNNVHAEPFGSHMAVMLEQMDFVSNMVLDHASGMGLPFQGSPSAGGMMSLAPDLTSGQVASAAPSYGADSQEARAIKPEPSANYDRLWLDGGLVDGEVDGDNGLGDYDYRVYGFAIGADLYNSEEFTGGLFAGMGRSKMDDHEVSSQEFESDLYYLGAYGQYRFEADWALSGMVGYLYSDTASKRFNPTVGSFTGGLAEADYDTHGLFAGLKAHRPYEFGDGFVTTPSVGFVYSHLWQDGIQESGGGAFGYSVDDASDDSLISSIGVDVTKAFEQGRKTWYPVAFARYEYDWLDSGDHEVTVANPNFGSFTQLGQSRGEHGVVAGAGLAVTIDDNVSIGGGYAYSWRSNGTEHGFGASLTVAW
jgi:uncharacterized protein with beta-barrel porin domain